MFIDIYEFYRIMLVILLNPISNKALNILLPFSPLLVPATLARLKTLDIAKMWQIVYHCAVTANHRFCKCLPCHLLPHFANSSGWNQTFGIGIKKQVFYHHATANNQHYCKHFLHNFLPLSSSRSDWTQTLDLRIMSKVFCHSAATTDRQYCNLGPML